MKRFATLALLASFAAAPLALAEDQQPGKPAQAAKVQHRAPARGGSHAVAPRNFIPRTNMQARTGGNSARFRQLNRPNISATVNRPNVNRGVYNTPAVRNNRINLDANRARNFDANRNAAQWRDRGNGNYRPRPNGNNYRRWANYRSWDRSRHDRGWWRSRYTRFALFGGGYYYYNSGFWYPAYGYDPYFTNYSYDGPIYAYNDLGPGQVIANVQTALLRRGYTPGPIDGTYGPATRDALLNFQSDNGLPMSGEIDEATLDSLGLN